jgi:uncharacterized membrane-anchored protein YhcB (DUF1043 family)
MVIILKLFLLALIVGLPLFVGYLIFRNGIWKRKKATGKDELEAIKAKLEQKKEKLVNKKAIRKLEDELALVEIELANLDESHNNSL